jgi:1,4-alpha-glucan branching enzyme
MPEGGEFREILNTDISWYGGSNVRNEGEITSQPKSEHGFEHSLTLKIPPLAALFLEKVKD